MPDQSRQLAAIMFTDIEGYTALMQADEERAIKHRERHRLIFESLTEKYKGRILQYYGDGTLSIFDSAIDAVLCAVEMQRKFQTEPMIPVRIGIHSGDIVFSEKDIIGDGVNDTDIDVYTGSNAKGRLRFNNTVYSYGTDLVMLEYDNDPGTDWGSTNPACPCACR